MKLTTAAVSQSGDIVSGDPKGNAAATEGSLGRRIQREPPESITLGCSPADGECQPREELTHEIVIGKGGGDQFRKICVEG